MLLFYSEATSSPLDSKALVAALLPQGSFKNMKTSIPKDLLKSDFFEINTLGLVRILWERQSRLAATK